MDVLCSVPETLRSHVPRSLVEYFAREDLNSAERLAGAALSYFGTPVFEKGRSRAAVDCIGLLCCALVALGIDYKDDSAYCFQDRGLYKKICKALPQAFRKARAKTFVVGDVVALRHAKCNGHVLMVLPRGYFVHAEGHKQISRVTIGTMGPDWVERLEQMGGEFSVWRLKT